MSRVLPSTYIIGIIVFTAIIMGGIFLIGSFRAQDPTFIDDDKYLAFNQTFNKYDDVSDSVNSLQGGLNATADFGVLGVLNSLIGTTWNSLRLLGDSFGFMNEAFHGLSQYLGFPTWVAGLIILAVIVVIVFALWSAVLQKDI